MTDLHTEEDVLKILDALVLKDGGVNAFAANHDVCAESVRLMIRRKRPPTGYILELCGFQKIVMYSVKNP